MGGKEESKVKKQIDVGSTVTARLHNGRVVVAKVTATVDSVAGRKVHITFGAFALIVDDTQILKECRSIVDYSVGSRIRVRLYSGKVVEAEITAITNQSTGRKVQIAYGAFALFVKEIQIIRTFED